MCELASCNFSISIAVLSSTAASDRSARVWLARDRGRVIPIVRLNVKFAEESWLVVQTGYQQRTDKYSDRKFIAINYYARARSRLNSVVKLHKSGLNSGLTKARIHCSWSQTTQLIYQSHERFFLFSVMFFVVLMT